MIITAGRLREQLCWSEPWTRFSARTGALGGYAAGLAAITVSIGHVLLILLIATAAGAGIIALVAVTGLADGPQLAAVFAVRQREAPSRLRGQIFITAASLKISAGALGAALAGILAQLSITIVLAAVAAAQAAALTACLARRRPARQAPAA